MRAISAKALSGSIRVYRLHTPETWRPARFSPTDFPGAKQPVPMLADTDEYESDWFHFTLYLG